MSVCVFFVDCFVSQPSLSPLSHLDDVAHQVRQLVVELDLFLVFFDLCVDFGSKAGRVGRRAPLPRATKKKKKRARIAASRLPRRARPPPHPPFHPHARHHTLHPLTPHPHLFVQVGLLQAQPRRFVFEHAHFVGQQPRAAPDLVRGHGRELGRQVVGRGVAEDGGFQLHGRVGRGSGHW